MKNINFNQFMDLKTNEKFEISKLINTKLNNQFDISLVNSIPVFHHRILGLNFVYVPSGEYNKGFSEEEESYAKKICNPPPINMSEMRPIKKVTVKHFLVTQTPVLNKHIARFISIDFSKEEEYFPIFLNIEKVLDICNKLKLRLPTENEWEYICRAGTSTLFPFGETLPDDLILEKWIKNDFSNLDMLECNKLGVYGMFTGEWCSDKYTLDYSMNSQVDENSYVIRGGGSFFWPWQDEEWVWCMSAMRMPSRDLYDGTCAFRLVYEIPKL